MEITHRLKFGKMSLLSGVMLNLLYRWINQLSKTEYAYRIMKMHSLVTGTKKIGNMSGACHTSNVGNAMCTLLATINTQHTTKWTVLYSVQ